MKSKQRMHLGTGKCEKQVVAMLDFNLPQLKQILSKKREDVDMDLLTLPTNMKASNSNTPCVDSRIFICVMKGAPPQDMPRISKKLYKFIHKTILVILCIILQ